MKNKGNGVEMTTRAVPREITAAVIELAKVCAKHDFPLDVESGVVDALLKLQNTVAAQKKVIASLEARLGIDDEL